MKSPDFRRTALSATWITALQRLEHGAKAERVAPLGTARLAGIAPRRGVEMRPGDLVGDEALQEHRRGDAAGHRRTRGVGEVGDVALQKVIVRVPERHPPQRVLDV